MSIPEERAGAAPQMPSRTVPTKLAVVVLGSHRSGTSAMTRVLALAGLKLPANLIPPKADNPKGFWESARIADLNDELLAALGTSWDAVFPIDDHRLQSELPTELQAAAAETLASEFGGATPIVLKDPRMCVLVEFWDQVLRESGYSPHYVIMVRNPEEVAASLAARNRIFPESVAFNREKGLLLWLGNMLAAERGTRGSPRAFVDFRELLLAPESVLTRVAQALEAVALFDLATTKVSEIRTFLDASLRHQQLSAVSRDDAVGTLVGDVYDWFTRTAHGFQSDPVGLHQAMEAMKFVSGIAGPLLSDQKVRLQATADRVVEARARADLADAEAARLREILGEPVASHVGRPA